MISLCPFHKELLEKVACSGREFLKRIKPKTIDEAISCLCNYMLGYFEEAESDIPFTTVMERIREIAYDVSLFSGVRA